MVHGMKKNLKEHIVYVVFTVIVILSIMGVLAIVMNSSYKAAKSDLDEAKISEIEGERPISEEIPVPTPAHKLCLQKEEVLAMKEIVLEGMKEDDEKNLCSLIKKANKKIENEVIYHRFFQILSDPDDLYWNSFDQTGEIQIGWSYDGKISKTDMMQKESLSEDEFYEKYGEQVVTYNDYNAEDFAQMLERCREAVVDESLRNDLQYVIDEVRLAQQTHEVAHVENFYHVLHDMDYFLLNYRLDTEGQYIQNKSTITRYYGVLSVYDKTKN